MDICPQEACCVVVGQDEKRMVEIDRDQCIACTSCVEACLNGARSAVGQRMTLDQILRECLSDEPFYKRSGGGVTLSGGDPLLFPDFCLELSTRLKSRDVHVAMETSCFADFEVIRPLLETIDLFIVDIKTMDPETHRQAIGWPLEPILQNIEQLIACDANVRIHLPIIPDFNDSTQNFHATIDFLSPFAQKLTGVDVLPFHAYGAGKYDFLGRTETYQYREVNDKPVYQVKDLAEGLVRAGISRVSVGGVVGMGVEKGERPVRKEVVN